MSNTPVRVAEDLLVQRCLAGDQVAWHTLYDGYDAGLRRFVLHLLGPGRGRADVVDEVLSWFWGALVESDYRRLRRVDSGRGRLRAFLATIAREQVCQWYRTAGRPGRRHVAVPQVHVSASAVEPLSLPALLEEFEPRLTPAERRFVHEELLAPTAKKTGPLTPRVKKLRQHIRDKLRVYLGGA